MEILSFHLSWSSSKKQGYPALVIVLTASHSARWRSWLRSRGNTKYCVYLPWRHQIPVYICSNRFVLRKLFPFQTSKNHSTACIRDAECIVSAQRGKSIASHRQDTNIVDQCFDFCEFVVVRPTTDRGHNQPFRWSGPFGVTAIHGRLA